MPERSDIFITYCFPEKRWLDRVQAELEPIVGNARCVVWDERKLRSGIAWKTELPDVLATTKVAMMIVSDLFLESDFVTRAKLPTLLEIERKNGLEICWVLASHCLFELAGLKESDAGNRVAAALDGLGSSQRDAEAAAIARKVAALLGIAPVAPAQAPSPKGPGEKQDAPSSSPTPGTTKASRKKRKESTAKNPGEDEALEPATSTPDAPVEPPRAPDFPEPAKPAPPASTQHSAPAVAPPAPAPAPPLPAKLPAGGTAQPSHPAPVLPPAAPTSSLLVKAPPESATPASPPALVSPPVAAATASPPKPLPIAATPPASPALVPPPVPVAPLSTTAKSPIAAEQPSPRPAAPPPAAAAAPSPTKPLPVATTPTALEPAPAPATVAMLIHSLDATIQTRQTTVLKLSRLARWLILAAGAIALASIVVAVIRGFTHFLLVAGFAAFVAGLALRLHARSRSLGQGLVGMRYTRSGLADEALPTRQREGLMRKAEDYLAQN